MTQTFTDEQSAAAAGAAWLAQIGRERGNREVERLRFAEDSGGAAVVWEGSAVVGVVLTVRDEAGRVVLMKWREGESPAAERPQFTSVAGWCRISGMGRTRSFQAIAAGALPAVKRGSRTLVDVEAGIAWMRSLGAARSASS